MYLNCEREVFHGGRVLGESFKMATDSIYFFRFVCLIFIVLENDKQSCPLCHVQIMASEQVSIPSLVMSL